ncbi:MAG: TlpA family protein disulfide reductase, partial [Woeseiaceae bacterium]
QLGGDPVLLSDNDGKVRVITFWASWCPPCRRELPVLAQIQENVGTDELQIYAVNFKESRRTYGELSGKLRKISEMIFVHDKTGSVGESYALQGLPFMIILGRDGKVAHIHRGYTDSVMETLITELNTLLSAN